MTISFRAVELDKLLIWLESSWHRLNMYIPFHATKYYVSCLRSGIWDPEIEVQNIHRLLVDSIELDITHCWDNIEVQKSREMIKLLLSVGNDDMVSKSATLMRTK